MSKNFLHYWNEKRFKEGLNMAHTSTHNGTRVSIKHNLRDEKWKAKDGHIKENGRHETWLHRDLKGTWNRLGAKLCQEHDDKQKRNDRKWGSYYNYIHKHGQYKECYEMIVGVYEQENENISEDFKETIYREFIEQFIENNPNLYVVGAYYHADEASPHLHIDYIPILLDKDKHFIGTGLTKALKAQGIQEGKTIKETCQILWEKRERERLDQICKVYDITVDHPIQEGKEEQRKHEDTATYKINQAKRDLNLLERKKDKVEQEISQKETDLQGLKEVYNQNENMLILAKAERTDPYWKRKIENMADEIVNEFKR